MDGMDGHEAHIERTPTRPDLSPTPDVVERAKRLGLSTQRLSDTIERDAYTPALIGLISNVLVWGGSRVFRHIHGIGTNEWRIVSALGNWPGSTATELCEILGINKSIASKSINELLDRGLVAQLDGPKGSRHLYLTPSGIEVHDDFMPVAKRRAEILHESLSEEESALLDALLVRMLASAESMKRYEQTIVRTDPAKLRGDRRLTF